MSDYIRCWPTVALGPGPGCQFPRGLWVKMDFTFLSGWGVGIKIRITLHGMGKLYEIEISGTINKTL